MIDAVLASEARELLYWAIAEVIQEVYPVTVEVDIGGDRSCEAILIEASQDILALVGAMEVFRRRAPAAGVTARAD
ncbi:MAG: hypothetical protein EON59_04560 [Alphaproteobacteria bacterium]|nr:MAG: hypothetical protein EON59_04560 [Alphaproteobacteria bacterium]